MDGEQWRREVLLDNIACAVRADLFRASGGFAAASHGEDVLFAYDLLCSGWSLVHQPAAVVEHGHDYDHRSVQKRYRADAVFFREQFGLRVRSNWISLFIGLPNCTTSGRVLHRPVHHPGRPSCQLQS